MSLNLTLDLKDLVQSLVVSLPRRVERLGLLTNSIWVKRGWVGLEKRGLRLVLIGLEAGSERIEIVAGWVVALRVELVGSSLNQCWLVVLLLLIVIVGLALVRLVLLAIAWLLALTIKLGVGVRRLRKMRALFLIFLRPVSILLLFVLLLPLTVITLWVRLGKSLDR